jgi:6-pyruvoyltetrahydropterin/6-carboxytetrahydropterin synthase
VGARLKPLASLYRAAAHFEAARQGFHEDLGVAKNAHHGHSFRVEIAAAAESFMQPGSGIESDQLHQHLVQTVAPLNFALLNQVIKSPTDQALAQWIATKLQLQHLPWLNLWCGPTQGFVLLGSTGHHWQRHRLEAAHRLPFVPRGHKCGRMHGHGFEVLLFCEPGRQRALSQAWQPLHAQLHHSCLNDFTGLENPTSEMLSTWLWKALGQRMEGLTAVLVQETANCGSYYDGLRHTIWKDFHFDSAIQLSGLPAGDSRARLHGHTYQLRLALSASLDTVMGWAVDYGDVKTLFQPILKSLDHHPLHEQGIAHHTQLAQAIFSRASEVLPVLHRLELMDTPGTGVSVGRQPLTALWGL